MGKTNTRRCHQKDFRMQQWIRGVLLSRATCGARSAKGEGRLWGAVVVFFCLLGGFLYTISDWMNSGYFCISEYIRHLNPEHLKIGVFCNFADVCVFGPMEEPRCE